MSISGVGQNYYHNNVATTKNVNSTKKPDGFAGKVTETSSVSPKDMTLEEYKAYFNEKMNRLYLHPSQRNMNDIIDITDAAYKRMQTDPEYEKKILNAIATNRAVNFGGYIPEIAYTHVDDTWEKCYGYTKGMKENVGYSRNSSTREADDGRQRKARQKKLMEERLEKHAEAKKRQQELLDEKLEKQQLESTPEAMGSVIAAYERNIMETVSALK